MLKININVCEHPLKSGVLILKIAAAPEEKFSLMKLANCIKGHCDNWNEIISEQMQLAIKTVLQLDIRQNQPVFVSQLMMFDGVPYDWFSASENTLMMLIQTVKQPTEIERPIVFNTRFREGDIIVRCCSHDAICIIGRMIANVTWCKAGNWITGTSNGDNDFQNCRLANSEEKQEFLQGLANLAFNNRDQDYFQTYILPQIIEATLSHELSQ